MQREIIITHDGSATVSIPDWQVTYHSKHGAIQESMHVFIEAGLRPLLNKYPTLHIFEMGFGTGLNALLTLIEATGSQHAIHYQSVEVYPLEEVMVKELNYTAQIQTAAIQQEQLKTYFHQLHETPWNEPAAINPYFTLTKYNTTLFNCPTTPVHLIYYDAFAPGAQPELWTVEAFQYLYSLLQPGGILVTYCSKGDVRRAMQAAGFTVEKIPGPPGKREMVRAKKQPA